MTWMMETKLRLSARAVGTLLSVGNYLSVPFILIILIVLFRVIHSVDGHKKFLILVFAPLMQVECFVLPPINRILSSIE